MLLQITFIFTLLLFLSTAGAFPNPSDKSNDEKNVENVEDAEERKSKFRSELIRQALDLIYRQKTNLNAVGINNCLSKYNDLISKLYCVKELIDESEIKKPDIKFNDNVKFIPYKNDEDDLDDYIELIKPNQRSHKYNFSQDYLDIQDLLRSKKPKKKYVFKIVNQNNLFDGTAHRRMDDKDLIKKEALRSYDAVNRRYKKAQKKKKYVADYSDSSSSASNSDESSEEDDVINLANKKKKSVIYMQGPSRLYKADSRKRLPHFFPKRVHWNEDEIKDLKNYWFDGPKGKYSGHYRTPY